MAATREQKIAALSDFLQYSAAGQVRGHSSLDGIGCLDHDEAFRAKAEELLELIEDDGYGYAEPSAQS